MKTGGIDKRTRPFIYILPSWAVIGFTVVFPILFTVYISFTNMNIYHWTTYTFDGLANYLRAFSRLDDGFLPVLLRTIVWTVVNLVLQFVIALAIALMLNVKGLRFAGFYKTILMISWAVPGYISALIWRNGMFNDQFGMLNQVIRSLGGHEVPWLNTDLLAFVSCLLVNLWLALPFMILVIYGGLQSIDHEYYDCAVMEGAGLFTRIRSITLPLLRPVLVPAMVLTAFVTFKQFDIVYLMTQQTGMKTGADVNMVITFAYQKAFVTNNYGYSAALSIIIFLIIIALTLVNRRLVRSAEERG